MGEQWDIILDAIEVFCGLYVAYQGYLMKKTGQLTSRSLIGKNIDLSRARDIPGYIQRMYPIYILCGALFFLVSAACLFLDLTGRMGMGMYFVSMGILFLDILLYAVSVILAQRRYLYP